MHIRPWKADLCPIDKCLLAFIWLTWVMTGRRSKWWRSNGWRMAATAQSLSHCFHQLSSLSRRCALGSSRFFPPSHTTGTQCIGAQFANLTNMLKWTDMNICSSDLDSIHPNTNQWLRIELFQMKILTTSRIANRSSSLHGQVELIKVCSAKWFKVPNITFTPTTWKSKVFISSGTTHKDTKGRLSLWKSHKAMDIFHTPLYPPAPQPLQTVDTFRETLFFP